MLSARPAIFPALRNLARSMKRRTLNLTEGFVTHVPKQPPTPLFSVRAAFSGSVGSRTVLPCLFPHLSYGKHQEAQGSAACSRDRGASREGRGTSTGQN